MITREAALFLVLFFIGLVVGPIATYLVGRAVFGEFGGQGFMDFFGTLAAKIRGGQPVAWFFVLSPYLVWQVLRLSVFGWRRSRRSAS